MTTVSRVVANIERSMEFYRQVFGFLPYGSPGRPLPNSAMEKLSNISGMRFRQLPVRLPNSGLLLRFIEFSNVERTPGKPKQVTDPGETHLRLEVSDVEAVVANLQRAGAQFVAPATAQAARTATMPILARDVDGFLLEIVKGIGSQGSNIGVGASPVLQARVVLAVDSMDRKLAFYKDIIGINVSNDALWGRSPLGMGDMRSNLSGDIGGPGRVIELRDYRNAGDKAPFKPRLQDPGASLLSYIIKDLAEVTKRVQAAKLPILTPEAKPVTIANLPRLIVQDPDGVFIELVQE
jgi:catechol 2,3-dioxygenase-like lactoylglutathione lyase family enzyme